jgi:hypothetical protein
MQENWVRWGLNLYFYTKDDFPSKAECHNAVANWLDSHPKDAQYWWKYTDGHGYYDILKKAAPELDKQVLEWCIEHWKKRDELHQPAL